MGPISLCVQGVYVQYTMNKVFFPTTSLFCVSSAYEALGELVNCRSKKNDTAASVAVRAANTNGLASCLWNGTGHFALARCGCAQASGQVSRDRGTQSTIPRPASRSRRAEGFPLRLPPFARGRDIWPPRARTRACPPQGLSVPASLRSGTGMGLHRTTVSNVEKNLVQESDAEPVK
jgi:hypothetical protein